MRKNNESMCPFESIKVDVLNKSIPDVRQRGTQSRYILAGFNIILFIQIYKCVPRNVWIRNSIE